MDRQLTFVESIREALDLCMEHDPSVYVMGLGVPDPKGIFGTTSGLEAKYRPQRVLDMPTSENGMTGVAIGSALVGMRPILVHQRLDFALLSIEQIVNQAAKWHYMYGGGACVPIVVRLLVGRGWGQGSQHSQSLQAWFAHIPGLKVVMPATPRDAKGLMLASVGDNNPVIYIEHRWLHHTFGTVPAGVYTVPLGKARIAREGADVTLAAISYGVVDALRSAEVLAEFGIQAEVVDIRTLRPWDRETVIESVLKTGRLIFIDTGWTVGGFGAEVLAVIAEEAWGKLKCPPMRFGMADCPVPTTCGLSRFSYPRPSDIFTAACHMMGIDPSPEWLAISRKGDGLSDAPNHSFKGPF